MKMRIGSQKDYAVTSSDFGADGNLPKHFTDDMVDYITSVAAIATRGVEGTMILTIVLDALPLEGDR